MRTYSLPSTASIAVLHPSEGRSEQSVCKRLSASGIDTGLVLPRSISVETGDGFDSAAVGSDTLSLASIKSLPFDPLPVLVSCLFPRSIFLLPFAFKELYASAFFDTGSFLPVK